ncbi:DUF676-domain-containing protein [Panus rudis PR-1116 ss-1]|nr:DUF676-domain-containing protein [Panus rudis PR-1116 ss-1]
MSSEGDKVHLLVLIHGMWGNPSHLAEMKRIYEETLCRQDSARGPEGERVHILVAETNTESSTYDGIDWGGERVTDEIITEVKRLEAEGETVTKFSVTGYSLGGLIARYVVGILHQRKFFDKVKPVNFSTVATPHIGIIRYPSFRSRLFATLGTRLLSRTGEQFYAQDKWSARGRPLLEVMADSERIFYQALQLFPHVTFYANAINDVTVPYMTAAAEDDDPFEDHAWNGIKIEIDEKYAPIIKSYTPGAYPAVKPPKPSVTSKEFWKGLKPRLPPRFDLKFPYNVIIIVSLPVLLPAILGLVVVRLSLDARSSRSRIKLLESDESYRERLVHIVGQLEKSMEDAVAEYMDDPGNSAPQTAPYTAPSSTSTIAVNMATSGIGAASLSKEAGQINDEKKPTAKGSYLLDVQHKMVKNLNTLPQLKKERAFIDNVMNAHAVIISRDVNKFKHHRLGEGVLRHMADHFLL